MLSHAEAAKAYTIRDLWFSTDTQRMLEIKNTTQDMARTNKRMAFYAVASLVAALLVWMIFKGNALTPAPGIAFVGWTNSSNGLLAHFRITNSMGYRSYLGIAPPEVQLAGDWPTEGVPAGISTFEIPIGSVTNVFVTAPTNAERWRLPVAYARRASHFEAKARKITNFIGWQMPPWHPDTHRVYTAYSAVISTR